MNIGRNRELDILNGRAAEGIYDTDISIARNESGRGGGSITFEGDREGKLIGAGFFRASSSPEIDTQKNLSPAI
jgi:hypothetical protein